MLRLVLLSSPSCMKQPPRLSNEVVLLLISPSSKLGSFADDTRVYSCINDIEKCDQLQIDLNSVYDWDHVNNF